MINLDTDIGSVSDQKFFFDLDTDGKEEEISFAGKGRRISGIGPQRRWKDQ